MTSELAACLEYNQEQDVFEYMESDCNLRQL
jgi:hypothetical protein